MKSHSWKRIDRDSMEDKGQVKNMELDPCDLCLKHSQESITNLDFKLSEGA